MAATTYAYNKNGNLKSKTDAEGNTEGERRENGRL